MAKDYYLSTIGAHKAIESKKADQSDAEAGLDNEKQMTPLRVAQAIAANPFVAPLTTAQLPPARYEDPENPTDNELLEEAKADKLAQIDTEFWTRAVADNIRIKWRDVISHLEAFGQPASPTANQLDLYANAARAQEAYDVINGYTDILDVQVFDTTVPSGTGYSGGNWA